VPTVSDANKTKIAFAAMCSAIGLGLLMVGVEFLNGRPDTLEKTIFGLPYATLPWAERVFMVLFGAIHLAVAAIITAFRRTAV